MAACAAMDHTGEISEMVKILDSFASNKDEMSSLEVNDLKFL